MFSFIIKENSICWFNQKHSFMEIYNLMIWPKPQFYGLVDKLNVVVLVVK